MKLERRVHVPSEGFQTGTRYEGGALRRFAVLAPHADRERAALKPGAAPLVEARTVYPATVVDAEESPRLLVSGANQGKIGKRITKGPWRGLPIYCLTLEERATCPASCHEWDSCYGNAMHLARRHRHGPELERLLSAELGHLAERHPDGFAVRLHILGDFYSVRYAARREDGGARERDPTGAGGNRLATRRIGTADWLPSCDCPEHQPVPQAVLDPFGGAGTTGLVADRLGRSAILIELNAKNVRLARARLTADAPLLTAAE